LVLAGSLERGVPAIRSAPGSVVERQASVVANPWAADAGHPTRLRYIFGVDAKPKILIG
jgi:hypothetical protein